MSAWVIERAREPGDAFEEAYAALDAEFGRRGELERKTIVEGWLRDGLRAEGLELSYILLTVRAPDGTLAAVRDAHAVVDRARGVCVLYLAHVLVLPPYRRQGLSARLRDEPIAIARGLLPDGELIVAGEMEHPSIDDEASIVRLVAYGRAGFRALSPRAMPYFQPDFRDPAAIVAPQPVPLLLIVLRSDATDELAKTLAEALLRHLYAVFASHCAEAQLASLRAHTLDALARWPDDTVPLLPLPASLDDVAALAPLQR